MNRPRMMLLARTCDDTTCGVCCSRWWDVCVAGWRCHEWPGRPLVLVGSDMRRLLECLAAEVRAGQSEA